MVNAPVHGDEPLQTRLVFHIGVVQACVEHDDGKRQDVAGVCCRKPHFSFLFASAGGWQPLKIMTFCKTQPEPK